MKLILTILFFSIISCHAQIKYVKGISERGRDANYTATALPMTSTVATQFRHQSDSLKTLWRWASDLEKVTIAQQKTINILRDSIAFLSIPDTTIFTNAKVTEVRKHFTEVEFLKND